MFRQVAYGPRPVCPATRGPRFIRKVSSMVFPRARARATGGRFGWSTAARRRDRIARMFHSRQMRW